MAAYQLFIVLTLCVASQALVDSADASANSLIENMKQEMHAMNQHKFDLMQTVDNLKAKANLAFQDVLSSSQQKALASGSCNHATIQQVAELANRKYGDFMGCINLTRELGAIELFGLHFYQYLMYTVHDVETLFTDLKRCYGYKNIFGVLDCVVHTLVNSTAEYTKNLLSLSTLLVEVEGVVAKIEYSFKNCFNRHSSEMKIQVNDILKKNCDEKLEMPNDTSKQILQKINYANHARKFLNSLINQ